MAASLRMVLMTALIAPMALSTRPLFSACSSSMRSSRPLRASTYLVASVSTTDSCLDLTSSSSCSNLSLISFDASEPTLHISGDFGLAGGDSLLRRRQVVADNVGDPRDDRVHLFEIEFAARLVEFVHLGGHPK
jgi:hypothetical protein